MVKPASPGRSPNEASAKGDFGEAVLHLLQSWTGRVLSLAGPRGDIGGSTPVHVSLCKSNLEGGSTRVPCPFRNDFTFCPDPLQLKEVMLFARRGPRGSTQLFASPSGSDVAQLWTCVVMVLNIASFVCDTALCMAWVHAGPAQVLCGFKRRYILFAWRRGSIL